MKAMMGILTTALLLNLFSVLAHARTTPAGKTPECILAGEGLALHSWVKHRILIADEAVAGANDMTTLSQKLQQLRHQGVCR